MTFQAVLPEMFHTQIKTAENQSEQGGKMKKKRTFLLILAAAAILTGCSDEDGSSSSSSSKSRRKKESRTEAVSETEPDSEATTQITTEIDEDNMSSGEKFYNKYSEKLIKAEDVKSSDASMTEADAVRLFKSRGFTEFPITYDFDTDGKYTGENEASESSSDKHPIYQTRFLPAEDDVVWSVMLVGDSLMAEPISYSYENSDKPEIFFSEKDHMISFDDESNRYFFTVPKAEVINLQIVSEINAELLNKYTVKELEKL